MAFFRQLDEDKFESTEYTRGPWDAASQHAGPPAALLARAVEQVARPGLRVARLTYDIARPVPIAPLTVTASMVREGRSICVVQAAIEPYMRCTALLIRVDDNVVPAVTLGPQVIPPSAASDEPFFSVGWDIGYHTGMEVRFASGSFLGRGPAQAWMRTRVPLVEGFDISPLQRVLLAADSGNGVSNVLDFHQYLFINADLTVHLHRYPAGEWVCLQAATTIESDGIGLADTLLHDENGPIGRSAQSLFVAARG